MKILEPIKSVAGDSALRLARKQVKSLRNGQGRMSEYPELQKEAAEARVGADRMAMGLSCIPDPLRGDMAEIERLQVIESSLMAAGNVNRAEVERLTKEITRLRRSCGEE